MVKYKVYVEGGSKGGLHTECRRAFKELIKKNGRPAESITILSCGNRTEALKDFKTALQTKTTDEKIFLLIDSECNVGDEYFGKPWEFLRTKSAGQLEKPSDSTDSQAHLMVECMEAWFLADLDAMKREFGKEYRKVTVPHGGHVDRIPKQDVMRIVDTASDGAYKKGKHSFSILERLDPAKVKRASPWAKRFLDEMEP